MLPGDHTRNYTTLTDVTGADQPPSPLACAGGHIRPTVRQFTEQRRYRIAGASSARDIVMGQFREP